MKITKYTSRLFCAALILGLAALLLPVSGHAQNAFGVTGTKVLGTGLATNSFAVVPARPGTPVLTFLNATTDTNTLVQFYSVVTGTDVNYTANNTTNFPVSSTNGFATGGIVVVRHSTNDTYETRYVFSVPSATNVVLSPSAPSPAVIVGDLLYPVTTAGNIPVNATTLSLSGSGIYSGQPGKPMLISIVGGTNATVNAAAGFYQ